MTINSTVNKAVFAGDGVQTSFSFVFAGVDTAYLTLTKTVAGVDTVLVRGTDYSVTLNAAAAGQIWGLGGTITYPLVGTPLAAGSKLTLLRTLPALQTTALGNQGGEFPTAVEQGIDQLAMIIQQISELNSRAIVVPASDAAAPAALPPAAQRASLAFIFDSNGDPAAGAMPASGVISSAMAPVVAAATLAAGRTALGLGTAAVEGIGGGLQDDGASKLRVVFAPSAVATNQAPVAADFLKRFVATGPITFTLARANTYWNGYGFWIDTYTDNITVAVNVNDQIKGTTAAGQSLTIPPGYRVYVFTDAAASGNWYIFGFLSSVSGNALPSLSGQVVPGGRLTLTTGVPVLLTDTAAAASIFYTPYLHSRLSLYDGVDWVARDFSEMSQALNDATKSPAAAIASTLYDMFGWDDVGTLRVTRGPAWTNSGAGTSARGAGAGTTALVYQNGIQVNANAITNGPAAKRGIYLGTIATDASVQLNMKMQPAAAAGGNSSRLDVWNMYNRVPIASWSKDSTDSWAYSTATWRSANNNNNNRVTFVCGLRDDAIAAAYQSFQTSAGGAAASASAGVGLNSVGSFDGVAAFSNSTNTSISGVLASYFGRPALGLNYVQALELATSGTVTWYGDAGSPLTLQMSISLNARM